MRPPLFPGFPVPLILALVCLPGCGGGKRAGRTPAGWTDITAEAGIGFRHQSGARGQKYLMETLGSGVCFLDYDGDDRQDLYLVNSGEVPGVGRSTARNALYRNLGGGKFRDVTAVAGVGDRGYGMGCTVADYDNDGDQDLYVTNYGDNRLFRNEGDGTFLDVTVQAGVGDPRWGTSSAFADFDNDGWVDLYVANYVDFRIEKNLYCGEPKPGYRTYCHPDNFQALPDVLYRNLGDGTFKDVTREAGLYTAEGKGLGVVWTDYDGDGDVDLYVANDATPNFLFRNRGDGTFENVTWAAGVGFSEEGLPEAGMGVDAGDFNRDGRMDLFVVNLSHETNSLYENRGESGFLDRTFESGLGQPSLLALGFGTGFLDFDNDGDLDIFVNNGHLLDNIHLYSDSVTYAETNMLFENLGGGRFLDVAGKMGEAFRAPGVGRGSAAGDWDDDGDLDLVVTHSGRPVRLLRNDLRNENHWVGLRLEGTRSNRSAIGARVGVEAGGVILWDEVRSASSYLSQNDLRMHVGVGAEIQVTNVLVRWPGGLTETWRDLPVDRYHHLIEGSGESIQQGN